MIDTGQDSGAVLKVQSERHQQAHLLFTAIDAIPLKANASSIHRNYGNSSIEALE